MPGYCFQERRSRHARAAKPRGIFVLILLQFNRGYTSRRTSANVACVQPPPPLKSNRIRNPPWHGKVVAVAFVALEKLLIVFLVISILLANLKRYFGIPGSSLDLIQDYLSERRQLTVLNGVKSNQFCFLCPLEFRKGHCWGRCLSHYSQATYHLWLFRGRYTCMQMTPLNIV